MTTNNYKTREMKQIKVRVYDIDGNKMSAGFDIEAVVRGDEDIQFPVSDETLPWKDFMFFRNEYSDLMPFTGQPDKSGKEIYEGDIVKHGESIRFVECRESRWLATRISKTETILLSFTNPEIIGNIYQHPELLLTNEPNDNRSVATKSNQGGDAGKTKT